MHFSTIASRALRDTRNNLTEGPALERGLFWLVLFIVWPAAPLCWVAQVIRADMRRP